MRTIGPFVYRRDDVVTLSRELLGKVLCSIIGGALTRAIITVSVAVTAGFLAAHSRS